MPALSEGFHGNTFPLACAFMRFRSARRRCEERFRPVLKEPVWGCRMKKRGGLLCIRQKTAIFVPEKCIFRQLVKAVWSGIFLVAPVVKWIERRFPKPLIRVRFPTGVRVTVVDKRCRQPFFLLHHEARRRVGTQCEDGANRNEKLQVSYCKRFFVNCVHFALYFCILLSSNVMNCENRGYFLIA